MSVCKKCGNEIESNSLFCGSCGERVDVPSPQPPKNDKKVLLLSVSLAVVTMILVALLAFIFGVKYVEKEESTVLEEKAEVADVIEQPAEEAPAEITAEIPAKPVKPVKTLDVYTASDIIKNVYVERALNRAVSSPEYKTYYDETFGFSIAYPTNFINTNSKDGVLREEFVSADGSAVFRINAGYNRGNVTPQELNAMFCALYGGEVTYNPVENSWFAISIVEGDNCRYAFYRVKNGKIYGFEFHLDVANLDIYRNYIETIYDTLK